MSGRDEMADMPVLEAGGVTRVSSSLTVRTIITLLINLGRWRLILGVLG